MAGDGNSLPTGAVVRKLAFTVVGVFLFAGGLTLLFEGMRAVMEIGGSCASGGPYQVRQQCPEGTGLIFAGIFGGLLGTGLVVAGTFRDGPKLWTLAWPALFLSLGWNFLDYGLDPPPPHDGLVWGWLICAVLFIAMGGIPLLFLLRYPKVTFWGTGTAPIPMAMGVGKPTAASRRTTLVSYPGADDTSGADDDIVSDLERLSVLHRSGQLSDREFAQAKAARLAEEGP